VSCQASQEHCWRDSADFWEFDSNWRTNLGEKTLLSPAGGVKSHRAAQAERHHNGPSFAASIIHIEGASVITSYRVGLVLGAVILAGGAYAAQGSHSREKTKSKPLIESIQGPELYKAYCASCHGSGAKGDGVMTASLKVKPSDLTRIAARNGGTFPLVRMERIISGEELPPTGHGSSQMPVWGPIFSHVERDQDLGRVRIDNLARYLRDIQVK